MITVIILYQISRYVNKNPKNIFIKKCKEIVSSIVALAKRVIYC